jgi:hypothetical protein
MCCFIRPGVVALAWSDNPDDPQARSRAFYNHFCLFCTQIKLIEPSEALFELELPMLQRLHPLLQNRVPSACTLFGVPACADHWHWHWHLPEHESLIWQCMAV